MRVDSWINIKDFELNNKVKTGLIYTNRSRGYFSEDVIKKVDGKNCVNEAYFVKRKKFRKRIWLINHNLFYFLTLNILEIELARTMSNVTNRSPESWSAFFREGLWKIDRESIISYKIPLMHWEFFRQCRSMLRVYQKQNNTNYSLSKLLEKAYE